MRKASADVKLCKGCRLCVGQCPKGAIVPLKDINKKGYEVIAVEEDKCIGCGTCYRVCPDYVFSVTEREE